jgi:hypothetical protein
MKNNIIFQIFLVLYSGFCTAQGGAKENEFNPNMSPPSPEAAASCAKVPPSYVCISAFSRLK